MKGKLPRIVIVVVAMAMALSLVATAATTTVIAEPGADSFSRMALPSTADYQMFPDTDIWDITAADDGTVFAIVQDTSGLRWFPMWSNFAVFKSTDGGYTWKLMWHIPANEPTVAGAAGVPVEIVPQPGYDDTVAANQVVFLATDDNLYRSTNGGKIFTRIVPECPGVIDPSTGNPYSLISSLDVAENINVPGTYVAVVGISWYGGVVNANGEGVFTWNEDNLLSWRDKRAGNVPYGRGYEALDVMFSPNYTDDGLIIAILNDWNIGDVVMSFWLSADGLWNGPTLSDAPFGTGLVNSPVRNTRQPAAGMDVADDFDYLGSPDIFAFVRAIDVYRIKALPPLPIPSTVTATGAAGYQPFSDILVKGPASTGTCYVGASFAAVFTDVIEATNLKIWPLWKPSTKAPAGSFPVWLTDRDDAILAASSTEPVAPGVLGFGFTTSGVSKRIEGPVGAVYNGIGLLDDLAVTTDLPLGTFYATMAYVEPSPNYANDDTIYVATASEWLAFVSPLAYQLSLWRQAPTGPDGAIVWERLLQEGTQFLTRVPGGKPAMANPGIFLNAPPSTFGAVTLAPLTWVPKVDPAFENSNFMFLLGSDWSRAGADQFWYSMDRGDTWLPASQMPLLLQAVSLSETGWCVVDTNTVLTGDSDGWVYKTTNRGNSWTDGAFTNLGVVTDLNVSPIYSEAGGVGSDKAVIAGVTSTGVVGAGLGQARITNEVWISLDGTESDFTMVCSELMWAPFWGGVFDGQLYCTVNFDADWATNSVVYGAASGAMADWWWNPAGAQVTLQDTEEVGVYRAVVNVGDTQASTWELLYGADDFIAETATPEDEAIMYLTLSDLNIGTDGTIYVPFSIYLDDSVGVITPFSVMRFTLGGMVRCLDGTLPTTEWSIVPQVLGPFDGLWLLPAVPGSNILFSAAYDVRDWRFKLVTYEDTLSGAGPAAGSDAPADGATQVGTLIGNMVSVPLSWTDGADTYELQVATDSAFTSPITTTTGDTSATVPGLESGVTYYWRVRATAPVMGAWGQTRSFTTATSIESVAPELLSPAAGAEAVSSTPTFSWSSIAGATSYQIQVATDSGFTSKEFEATTSATAYQSTEELEDGTYYWRVKATTDWSATGVFTVGPVPAAGTPVWVWVVIAIGAVLLIAVLVLVMRTRRAV
jgi:hypothetical protein